jgi:hypothetical protein
MAITTNSSMSVNAERGRVMTKPFQVERKSGDENDDRELLAGGASRPSA